MQSLVRVHNYLYKCTIACTVVHFHVKVQSRTIMCTIADCATLQVNVRLYTLYTYGQTIVPTYLSSFIFVLETQTPPTEPYGEVEGDRVWCRTFVQLYTWFYSCTSEVYNHFYKCYNYLYTCTITCPSVRLHVRLYS